MKFTSLFLSAALLGLSACNNAPKPTNSEATVDQNRPQPAASTDAIDVATPLNMHISIGSEASCKLKGPARIVSRLKTEMEGNTFRIFSDSKANWSSNEPIEAWITVPHLRSLRTAGAGSIVIESRVEEPAVELDLSGATNLDIMDIRTPQLKLELGGTGKVVVHAGEVGNGSYSILGTGNIEAFELKTQNAEVSVAGAGRAALTAINKLDASISGTGMIRYKGNPAIEKSISGTGALQNAN
jgi:hypothetical protein